MAVNWTLTFGKMRLSFLLKVSFIAAFMGLATSEPAPEGFIRSGSRKQCQTSLRDCAKGTILVSKDHPKADFRTIQSAIASLPDDSSPQTILVLAGDYTEQLNVTRAGPITLLGQTDHITDASRNKATVYWSAANHHSSYPDNVYTSVLTVAPTLNASLTGAGPTGFPVPEDTPFGNVDFRVYNVDFRNAYSGYSDGPAHALSFSRSNGGFYYCGFYSYQDTVSFLKDPYIHGFHSMKKEGVTCQKNQT